MKIRIKKQVMQKGGTLPPIYTSNPQDKRLKAYNDSLTLYNTKKFNVFTENGPNRTSDPLQFKEYIPYNKLGKLNPNLENFEIGDTNVQSSEKVKVDKTGKATSSKPEFIIHNRGEHDAFINASISDKEEFYKKVNPKIKPIGFNKYTDTFDDGRVYNQYSLAYKKPVQPVVYQKPQQTPIKKRQPTYEDSMKLYKSTLYNKNHNGGVDYNPRMNLNGKDASFIQENFKDDRIKPIGITLSDGHPVYKKPIGQPQRQPITAPISNPTSAYPQMEIGQPNVQAPNLKQANYDMSQKTKFAFTYPTENYLEQKSLYFPDLGTLKSFAKGYDTEVSEGGDKSWGQALTHKLIEKFQKGGKFDPIAYLYGDDDEAKPLQKSIEKAKQKRITEEDIDNGDDEMINEILNMDSSYKRMRNSSGTIGPKHGGSRNNYGNIMTKSGQYMNYATPEEGRIALINQLNLYQTGKTKTGVTGDHTLREAMHIYASDAPNYSDFIAKKLGITPDTKIKNIDKNKWADAIAKFEGNTNIDTKQYEQGGEFTVDFNTMKELQRRGIKFKLL